MSRRLLSLFIVATLGMTPQGWGTEPEVTPIIRFGNPADAARISVASARISEVTGARVNAGGTSAREPADKGQFAAGTDVMLH